MFVSLVLLSPSFIVSWTIIANISAYFKCVVSHCCSRPGESLLPKHPSAAARNDERRKRSTLCKWCKCLIPRIVTFWIPAILQEKLFDTSLGKIFVINNYVQLTYVRLLRGNRNMEIIDETKLYNDKFSILLKEQPSSNLSSAKQCFRVFGASFHKSK